MTEPNPIDLPWLAALLGDFAGERIYIHWMNSAGERESEPICTTDQLLQLVQEALMLRRM